MEIISYFDSKTCFCKTKAPHSLDEMLQSQYSREVLKRDIQRETDKLINHSGHIIDMLCIRIAKAKIGAIIVCVALTLLLVCAYAVQHIHRFAHPLEITGTTSVESLVLYESMHDFVFSSSSKINYYDETIALLDPEKSASFYSLPVSFSSYTVQPGDSIHSISKKFNLENISTLIGINEVSNARLLWAGQELQIPSIDGLFYTIKKGDSLDSIAKNYSISIEEILDVNELESSVIIPGERLFIPGARLDTVTLKQATGELFIQPLSGTWRISSQYGYRADPFTGVRAFHSGIDLAVPEGTPVRAVMSGTVSTVGYSSLYGYYVIINHGNSYQTLYAHFVSPAPVKKGQTVTQGSTIGYVGNTGYSTGNHLHFSVYKDGTLINPTQILQF
ncbi:MAG: M23 family metallopeptidase [Spirochaetales bacterium]